MGIYDRDYERSYDTGSGWRDSGGGGAFAGGMGGWTANGKLIVAMVVVYLAQVLLGEPFSKWFALPSDWWREPWRVYELASYAMLHSTQSLNHILFNSIALFFFGRPIEARLGSREYIAFFFAGAVFAALAWSGVESLADPGQGRAVLIGASGGIAAVLVLFALKYPHVQVYLMGILPVPAWLMAVLFIGQDVMGAVNRSGNVAYTAHLGGALFGYLYYRSGWRVSGWLPGGASGGAAGLGSLFKRGPKLRVHREDDETTPASPGEERVDEILRKIQSQGQASLTREEQKILEQASRRYQQRRR